MGKVMNLIIIFGPPGAGKGTQAELLVKKFNLVHLSTGALLREAVKNKTSLGMEIEGLLAKGELVSDDIIIKLVEEFLALYAGKKGIILDGSPRTIKQAEMLDPILEEFGIDDVIVINLAVDDEELIKRLVKRGVAQGRSDDNEETIRNRLKVYYSETLPVLEFYRGRGKVIDVDGLGEINKIYNNVVEKIESLRKA